MRKITRSGLKAVVKECLVEILSEGLSSPEMENITESKRRIPGRHSQSRSQASSNDQSRPALDHVRYNNTAENRIKDTVSQMTNDSVLSSILEDTARTTLQEQTSAESSRSMSAIAGRQGDAASRTAAQSDPSDLFGDASSKWADLAFAPPINKNR